MWSGTADAIATFHQIDLRHGAARLGIPAEEPSEVLKRIGGLSSFPLRSSGNLKKRAAAQVEAASVG